MQPSFLRSTAPSLVTPPAESPASFCPVCWRRLDADTKSCPACGTDIAGYLSQHDYVDLLIAALRHPDAGRRLLAAGILGERRETRALPALREILLGEARDVYLVKAAVVALGRIGGQTAVDLLHHARRHPTVLVRRAAIDALAQSGIRL